MPTILLLCWNGAYILDFKKQSANIDSGNRNIKMTSSTGVSRMKFLQLITCLFAYDSLDSFESSVHTMRCSRLRGSHKESIIDAMHLFHTKCDISGLYPYLEGIDPKSATKLSMQISKRYGMDDGHYDAFRNFQTIYFTKDDDKYSRIDPNMHFGSEAHYHVCYEPVQKNDDDDFSPRHPDLGNHGWPLGNQN